MLPAPAPCFQRPDGGPEEGEEEGPVVVVVADVDAWEDDLALRRVSLSICCNETVSRCSVLGSGQNVSLKTPCVYPGLLKGTLGR